MRVHGARSPGATVIQHTPWAYPTPNGEIPHQRCSAVYFHSDRETIYLNTSILNGFFVFDPLVASARQRASVSRRRPAFGVFGFNSR